GAAPARQDLAVALRISPRHESESGPFQHPITPAGTPPPHAGVNFSKARAPGCQRAEMRDTRPARPEPIDFWQGLSEKRDAPADTRERSSFRIRASGKRASLCRRAVLERKRHPALC